MGEKVGAGTRRDVETRALRKPARASSPARRIMSCRSEESYGLVKAHRNISCASTRRRPLRNGGAVYYLCTMCRAARAALPARAPLVPTGERSLRCCRLRLVAGGEGQVF